MESSSDSKKKLEGLLSTTVHKMLQEHSLLYVLRSHLLNLSSSDLQEVLKCGFAISVQVSSQCTSLTCRQEIWLPKT